MPQEYTSPSAETDAPGERARRCAQPKHLIALDPTHQEEMAKSTVPKCENPCCPPRPPLTCPDGYSESIPTGHHRHLDALEALDLTGCSAALASTGAQLPVLITAESVAISRSWGRRDKERGLNREAKEARGGPPPPPHPTPKPSLALTGPHRPSPVTAAE